RWGGRPRGCRGARCAHPRRGPRRRRAPAEPAEPARRSRTSPDSSTTWGSRPEAGGKVSDRWGLRSGSRAFGRVASQLQRGKRVSSLVVLALIGLAVAVLVDVARAPEPVARVVESPAVIVGLERLRS